MIHPVRPLAPGPIDDIDADQPPDVVAIEDLVRHFAVQHFVQALMGGDPELTGIPDLTAQDG